MALTDELREWAKNHRAELNMGQLSERTILDIAGHIEATVTSQLYDAECSGYMRAIDEFCDKSLHLPVDADGKVIHLGDHVDGISWEDGIVTSIKFEQWENGKINASIAVRPHGWDTSTWHDPEDYRHHHEPTVEDVLREFADAMSNTHPLDVPARIAEYAAKLRLTEKNEDACD